MFLPIAFVDEGHTVPSLLGTLYLQWQFPVKGVFLPAIAQVQS